MRKLLLMTVMITSMLLFTSCASRAVRNQPMTKNPAPAVETDPATVISETVVSNSEKISNGNVAVADFTDIDGKEIEEGKIMSERIVTRLTMKGNLRFKVIEREKLHQVLDEQKLGLAGITEEGEGSIGKLMNADVLLAGTLLDQDGDREITARLVNVRTGEIYAASIVKISKDRKMKDYAGLTADQKNRIDNENKMREELKVRNPRLYGANQKVRSEMILLREKDPQTFGKCLAAITIVEKVRAGAPGFFILATEPDDSAMLKNIQAKNPARFTKINNFRKRLLFVTQNVPSYKEKLVLEREVDIALIKK